MALERTRKILKEYALPAAIGGAAGLIRLHRDKTKRLEIEQAEAIVHYALTALEETPSASSLDNTLSALSELVLAAGKKGSIARRLNQSPRHFHSLGTLTGQETDEPGYIVKVTVWQGGRIEIYGTNYLPFQHFNLHRDTVGGEVEGEFENPFHDRGPLSGLSEDPKVGIAAIVPRVKIVAQGLLSG